MLLFPQGGKQSTCLDRPSAGCAQEVLYKLLRENELISRGRFEPRCEVRRLRLWVLVSYRNETKPHGEKLLRERLSATFCQLYAGRFFKINLCIHKKSG